MFSEDLSNLSWFAYPGLFPNPHIGFETRFIVDNCTRRAISRNDLRIELDIKYRHLIHFCNNWLNYRFLDGFILSNANTFWDFREQLIKSNLIKSLFIDFEVQLTNKGFMAEKGSIVDASFVEAPNNEIHEKKMRR